MKSKCVPAVEAAVLLAAPLVALMSPLGAAQAGTTEIVAVCASPEGLARYFRGAILSADAVRPANAPVERRLSLVHEGDGYDLLLSADGVVRYNDDGSGDWLALEFGQNGLTPENGFTSQADVLINTRLAADHVGATPMDRPEWSTVHPETRMVYITMTNNTARTEPNAANPRTPNPYGHIIRWEEQGGRPWATRFQWDIFALAGDAGDSAHFDGDGNPLGPLDETNSFSSPDGLWFDNSGILWIETDGNSFGHDCLLAAIPETGEIRRFMTAVPGSEVTGLTGTPDRTVLFANIQHPGGNWPDGGSNPPRSATMVISRNDGGVVGGELLPVRENGHDNGSGHGGNGNGHGGNGNGGGYGHGNGGGHSNGGGYGANNWLRALLNWGR